MVLAKTMFYHASKPFKLCSLSLFTLDRHLQKHWLLLAVRKSEWNIPQMSQSRNNIDQYSFIFCDCYPCFFKDFFFFFFSSSITQSAFNVPLHTSVDRYATLRPSWLTLTCESEKQSNPWCGNAWVTANSSEIKAFACYWKCSVSLQVLTIRYRHKHSKKNNQNFVNVVPYQAGRHQHWDKQLSPDGKTLEVWSDRCWGQIMTHHPTNHRRKLDSSIGCFS